MSLEGPEAVAYQSALQRITDALPEADKHLAAEFEHAVCDVVLRMVRDQEQHTDRRYTGVGPVK